MGAAIAACPILLALTCVAFAGDWLSERGDPKRTGWQRTGKQLTVDNVKDLRLLWRRKLDSAALSSPVILGPTITFRGVRELVFVMGSGNDLYAVDADFGTVFWKRHFEVTAPNTCSSEPATPAIEPDEDYDPEDMSEEDEGDSGPMRPLYVLTTDGRLHTVRVSDGADTAAPYSLVPANVRASGLNAWDGKVHAVTLAGCSGVADPKPDLAQWLDRWSFQTVGNSLRGLQGKKTVWTVEVLSEPRPPVVTNGIVFTLSNSPATLRAFDALTGKPLFAGKDEIGNVSPEAYLATANGHLCFTSSSQLLCYGIPMER